MDKETGLGMCHNSSQYLPTFSREKKEVWGGGVGLNSESQPIRSSAMPTLWAWLSSDSFSVFSFIAMKVTHVQ